MSKMIEKDFFEQTGAAKLGATLATVLLASLLTACGGGSSSTDDTANTGGTTVVDTDKDGIPDSSDAFPNDATESVDTDKDGIGNNADTDDDGDTVADTSDNCPLISNKDQADYDADGIGNACDSTPGTAPTGTTVNGYTLLKADGTGAATIGEAACVQKNGLTWVMPMGISGDGTTPAVFRHENNGVADYVTNFASTCGLNNGWRLPTVTEMKSIVLSVDGSSPLLALQDGVTGFVFDSMVFTDTKAAGTYTVPGYIPFCTNDVTKAVSLSFQGSTVDAQVLDLTNPSTIDPNWTSGNYPCYIRMVNGSVAP